MRQWPLPQHLAEDIKNPSRIVHFRMNEIFHNLLHAVIALLYFFMQNSKVSCGYVQFFCHVKFLLVICK